MQSIQNILSSTPLWVYVVNNSFGFLGARSPL